MDQHCYSLACPTLVLNSRHVDGVFRQELLQAVSNPAGACFQQNRNVAEMHRLVRLFALFSPYDAACNRPKLPNVIRVCPWNSITVEN